jgi:hypothetical protein
MKLSIGFIGFILFCIIHCNVQSVGGVPLNAMSDSLAEITLVTKS